MWPLVSVSIRSLLSGLFCSYNSGDVVQRERLVITKRSLDDIVTAKGVFHNSELASFSPFIAGLSLGRARAHTIRLRSLYDPGLSSLSRRTPAELLV